VFIPLGKMLSTSLGPFGLIIGFLTLNEVKLTRSGTIFTTVFFVKLVSMVDVFNRNAMPLVRFTIGLL
jgi:hypothetical protein